MSDTQWPRFFVFKKDSIDAPYLNCGSIHAPDIEMALLNARDVFVRRPNCVSLWVAPVSQVAEVTVDGLPALTPDDSAGPEAIYEVFTKPATKGQHAHAGQVTAHSAEAALQTAAETYTEDTWVWMVVPQSAIVSSPDDEGPDWFEAALDKPFRHQSFYRTESLIREIKAEQQEPPDGER